MLVLSVFKIGVCEIFQSVAERTDMPLLDHVNVSPDQSVARNFPPVFCFGCTYFLLDIVYFFIGRHELKLLLDAFISAQKSESEREQQKYHCRRRQEEKPFDFIVHCFWCLSLYS